MRRITDQTLGVSIGRKDGVVVQSMMRMLHLVDVAAMFPMMMVSPCTSYYVHF